MSAGESHLGEDGERNDVVEAAKELRREFRFEDALAHLDLAEQQDHEVRALRSRLLLDLGRARDAQAIAQEIVDEQPDSPAAVALLAACLVRRRKPVDAEELVRSALDRRPNEPGLSRALVEALVAQRRSHDAVDIIDRVAQANPNDAAIQDLRVEVHRARHDDQAHTLVQNNEDNRRNPAVAKILKDQRMLLNRGPSALKIIVVVLLLLGVSNAVRDNMRKRESQQSVNAAIDVGDCIELTRLYNDETDPEPTLRSVQTTCDGPHWGRIVSFALPSATEPSGCAEGVALIISGEFATPFCVVPADLAAAIPSFIDCAPDAPSDCVPKPFEP